MILILNGKIFLIKLRICNNEVASIDGIPESFHCQSQEWRIKIKTPVVIPVLEVRKIPESSF